MPIVVHWPISVKYAGAIAGVIIQRERERERERESIGICWDTVSFPL